MTSVVQAPTLHMTPSWNLSYAPCHSVSDRVAGLAVCSLPSEPRHSRHRFLCDETGSVIGEWTDFDLTFQKPRSQPHSLSHVA